MRKKVLTHVGIVVLFLIVSLVYFAPVLEGKKVRQGDTQRVAVTTCAMPSCCSSSAWSAHC